MTTGFEMNRIKILFFATIRDKAGTKSVELNIPNEMTVQALKEKLANEYPNLKDSLKVVLVSVNQEYSFDDAIIPSNAEIALFPPVSGG
ncbi:MAG TPA: molybdopterin converting factor subunit 1 [Anaerolineae bacterium]|nr:molybdopterin converting factor subunit 1 [Anaerolineae bacterium]